MYTFLGAATQLRVPRSLYAAKNRNFNSIAYPDWKIDGNRDFFVLFSDFFCVAPLQHFSAHCMHLAALDAHGVRCQALCQPTVMRDQHQCPLPLR